MIKYRQRSLLRVSVPTVLLNAPHQ